MTAVMLLESGPGKMVDGTEILDSEEDLGI